MRKILSAVLIATMLCTVFSLPSGAETGSTENSVTGIKNADTSALSQENDYDSYLSENPDLSYSDGAVDATLQGDMPASLETGKTLNMSVSVGSDGWYELYLTYVSLNSGELAISMNIDGKAPFTEAEKLSFPSYWVNNGNIRYDNNGNQVAPEQVLYTEEAQVAARDYIGVEKNPYRFYLTAGSHSIVLSVLYGKAELKAASFVPVADIPTYEEYANKNPDTESDGEPIVIQGEEAVIKNSRSLIPLSDKRNADMTPADAVKGKLNYIGGTNWKNPGDTVTWEIEVEKTGYYRLGTRYRQSEVVGSPSYRELRIDGKIPFEEAQSVKFTYSSDWSYTEFENDGEPYLFYLTEGKHTVSLSVTGGEMIDIYKELRDITTSLGDLYVDITMIIGETVDVQRSYELFNQIPNFNKRLEENINALSKLAERIEKLQESTSGTTVSIIDSAVQTLTMMLENPYSAHKYKSSYYTAYTNLSAQMGSILNMPLDIDEMCFVPENGEYKSQKASFIERVGFSFSRFFSSFANDYEASDENGDDTITIWVNWGRDQAQALNNAILNSFEPEYGISVNVKVVNATLVQAILSGKGPDVMLQMARSEPVNLAMRGGLIDLSGFEGFDETVALFRDGATVPYEYRGGTYALPDTQNFNMMFARTDILAQLGVKIPETWDEFINAITILQRSNLQVCMPQTLSATMLVQNGLSYYNEELNGTALADADCISTLIDYTDYFTEYKVPKTMDFYNRFRIGSAPLGISVYTLGTQLQAAAPEIDGCWEMYPLPGMVDEDGNINYTSAGEGTGCGITKLSQNTEAAWKFLKWWVSKDTQIAYSNELETVLGPLGRVAVSNTQALSEMGWEPSKLSQINKQWTQVEEMPQIAGSYYVDRSITQIFWNVVEMNENPKDTIVKWAAIADSEIARKQQEYENR